MSPRWLLGGLWAVAVAICLFLTVANLFYGELNQDEGWYLYAGRMVSEGKLPYRHFAFTQGPVMPFVYAAVQPLVSSYGVAGGRLFTAVLGLLAAVGTAVLAARLCGNGRGGSAAFVAFVIVAINVYQSYFTTVVKTYSLCALFIVGGFLLLSYAERGIGGRICAALAGAFLLLAAATRLSAGVILPVVAVSLLVHVLRQRRPRTSEHEQETADRGPAFAPGGSGGQATNHEPRTKNKERGTKNHEPAPPRLWLWFGIGATVAFCVVFLPFILLEWENVRFGLFEYHSSREVGSAFQMLVYKGGFVSRVVQAYFVASALCVVVLLYRMFGLCRQVGASGGTGERASYGRNLLGTIWISAEAMTLVHLAAAFPYDDYQAAVFPLFAAAVACAVVFLPGSRRGLSWIVVSVLLLCIAASFSSPINQDWVISGRDRIWWRTRSESPLAKLHRTAEEVKALSGDCDVLLTQDTYLAVEAGMRVPAGMEMGPFCYYPAWDAATASKRRVLNREMLEACLTNSGARVAAFSGYGLAISSPAVTELPEGRRKELLETLGERYAVHSKVDHFGQASTTLVIFTNTQVQLP